MHIYMNHGYTHTDGLSLGNETAQYRRRSYAECQTSPRKWNGRSSLPSNRPTDTQHHVEERRWLEYQSRSLFLDNLSLFFLQLVVFAPAISPPPTSNLNGFLLLLLSKPTDSCRQHTNDIQLQDGPVPSRGFGRLCIASASRSSMGAYFCIASNGIPPSVSKRIQLVVLCKLPHWRSPFSIFSFYYEQSGGGIIIIILLSLSLSLWFSLFFFRTNSSIGIFYFDLLFAVPTQVRSEKPLVGAPAGAQAVSLDCIVEASPQPNHFLWYKGSKLRGGFCSID